MSSATRGPYKRYSTETKLKLIQGGNPQLLVDEGVPRTTAIYWLKNSQKILGLGAQGGNLLDAKIQALQKKLEDQQVLVNLILKVREIYPDSLQKRSRLPKPVKKKIIAEVQEAAELVPLNKCLSHIGLSSSSYRRWLSIFKKCEFGGGECTKRFSHQLTSEELLTMKQYARSLKYQHLPVSSRLQLRL